MSQFWPPRPSDTGWVTITVFENGWSPDPGWGPVQVRRIGNQVIWRGQLTGGTDGAALTIPDGFRPVDVGTGIYWPAITAASASAVTRVAVHGSSPTKISLISGTRPNLAVVRYTTD